MHSLVDSQTQYMENSMEKNVAMFFIPTTRATELLSTEVSSDNVSGGKKKLQIDIEDKLAITEFNGETQPNLDSVISHYIQSLNQTNLRFLGTFHVITCFTLFLKYKMTLQQILIYNTCQHENIIFDIFILFLFISMHFQATPLIKTSTMTH